MATFQNSLSNRNLTITQDGVPLEELTESIDFSVDFDWSVMPGEGHLRVDPRPRVLANNAARSLDTNFVVSADRDSWCSYTFELTAGVLAVSSAPRVNIQIRPTSADTFVTVSVATAGLTGLFVGAGEIITRTPSVIYVPRGYEVRFQTVGGGTKSVIANQEVLL